MDAERFQLRDDALAMAARRLIQQVRLSKFKDEKGHKLEMNIAYQELERLVMPSPDPTEKAP